MRVSSLVTAAMASTSTVLAAASLPSLSVPSCPRKGTVQYTTAVPNGKPGSFPKTQVDLCYDKDALHLTFTAYNETNFFYNTSYGINDPIYEYEVMEAFIAPGTAAPQTYLEFEVAPNNVTWHAFIYNPSKVRAAGAPFENFPIRNPTVVGITAETTLDKAKKLWVSDVKIPLGLFNVEIGQAKGTKWRMNFFRTVVAPQTFPDQWLGAWSPPDEASFHKTPFFGNVVFV